MLVRFTCAIALAIACCNDGGAHDAGLDAIDVPEPMHDSGIPGVSVDLGTGGESSFEEIPTTGAPPVQLIHGAQGGYHVWGRVRFSGFQPDVDIWFIATRISDGAVLHDASVVLHRWIENGVDYGLQDLGGGYYTTAQPELIVLNIPCPAAVLGQQLFVQVFVRERVSQRIATDWRTVTVVRDAPPIACPDL